MQGDISRTTSEIDMITCLERVTEEGCRSGRVNLMKRRSFLWLLGCGATAGASIRVRAQQAVPLVGVVVAGTHDTSTFPEPFLSSMKRLGWDEDHNYRVPILGTEGHNDRYP